MPVGVYQRKPKPEPTDAQKLARLERGYIPEPNSGCWLWTEAQKGRYALSHKGYGMIKWRGIGLSAHRFSWEIHNGPIPNGMWVLHRCDNPPCVNPEHLFLGTALDNNRDRDAKGRKAPFIGETHGRAKLTQQQVYDIRQSALSNIVLARTYNVTRSLISKIRLRNIWTHI